MDNGRLNSMIPEPTEARYDPETGRIALKTALEPSKAWFIFGISGGGHYAPGTRSPDDVTDWLPYTPPVVGDE